MEYFGFDSHALFIYKVYNISLKFQWLRDDKSFFSPAIDTPLSTQGESIFIMTPSKTIMTIVSAITKCFNLGMTDKFRILGP